MLVGDTFFQSNRPLLDKKRLHFTLFHLLFISTITIQSTSKQNALAVFKELRKNCVPIVNLKGCNTGFVDDPKWIWSRRQSYVIPSIVTKGCTESKLEYSWLITNYETGKLIKRLPEFKNKSTFLLKTFVLGFGRFVLLLKVSELYNNQAEHAEAKCLIKIRAEDPIPLILGGSSRTVVSNKSFRMEGNYSVNLDANRPGTTLYYKWSCKQEPENTFCKDFNSYTNFMIVPATYVTVNTKFLFHMEVRTGYSSWFGAEQTVYVKDGAHPVYIRCMTNCVGKITHRSVTYVKVACQNCPSENYEWSMKPGEGNQKTTIDFEQETVFGKNSPRLMIKANILVPGDVYEFIVAYDGKPESFFQSQNFLYLKQNLGGNTISSIKIKVDNLPKIGSCNVVPTEGKSLITLFEVTCKDVSHSDPLTYKLYQSESGSTDLGVLLSSNAEGIFHIYLSTGKTDQMKLMVKIGDSNGLFDTRTLSVTVKSAIADIPADKQIEEIMKKYQGKGEQSVKSLIRRGDIQGAVQALSALTVEVQKLSSNVEDLEEFKWKYKLMVIGDLSQLPLNFEDVPLKISKIIRKLHDVHIKPDRVLSKFVVKLCKMVANEQLRNVLEARSPNVLSTDTEEIKRDLLQVTDECMKPNEADLQKNPIDFNVTTPFPPLDLLVIPEDYPNYDDADVKYIRKRFDYQAISVNGVEVFNVMGRAVSLTMASGEPMATIKDDEKVFQYQRDEAQQIANQSFGGFYSFAKTSRSMRWFGEHPAHAVSIAFAKNPLWWNKESEALHASVMYFDYYLTRTRPQGLPRPTEFFFKVDKYEMGCVNGSVSVPRDLDKWTPENLDYCMSVHRVNVRKGSGLGVIFVDLSDQDQIQVVVTYARRPNTKDFKEAHIITQNNSGRIFFFPPKLMKYGDTWFYLGILPDKSMISSIKADYEIFTFNYNFTITSPTCVHWHIPSDSWTNKDCWTGEMTNLHMLHCNCKSTSLHSGFYEIPENKLNPINRVAFVLQLQTSYVVFICQCSIYLIYCVALIYSIKWTRMTSKQTWFLADNAPYERYAYLVVIKTGSPYSAGTTSRIGLKIFGKKCNSRAHIVNHPDPEEELLQRNQEDWFVLTTEKHLGEVKKIYLWHDSSGMRSDWYCEWITIYDLQRGGHEWQFKVQKWFSVLRTEDCYISLKRVKKTDIPDTKRSFLKDILTRIKQEHTWFVPTSASVTVYKIRITLMLSIILTTYFFALIFYGVPMLRLYDGLGHGHFAITFKTILIALLSSVLSFLVNLFFVNLFELPWSESSVLRVFLRKHLAFKGNRFAWIAVISTIMILITLITIFSFWLPYVTSLLWICSTLGALVQSIFLLENVYLCTKTILTKRKAESSTSTMNIPQIIKQVEKQRHYLYRKFGQNSLRPYYLKNYHPLTREEWKIRRQEELTRLKLAELIQDLIMFSIYLILLYNVVLADTDPLNIYSHQEMMNMIHGVHTKTMSFYDIQSINDIYTYINETFFLTTHSFHWYGEMVVLEPGLLADFNSKILGVARFRQQRVCKDCCSATPPLTQPFNISCNPELSSQVNDIGEYMEHWEAKEFVTVPRLIDVWKYKTDATPTIGKMMIYSSGGYSGPLGRTLYNSHYNLLYYENTGWIDERTRVLFVEFLTYNANYNIFNAVKIVIELTASGLYVTSSKVFTARLLFLNNQIEMMVILVYVIFILMILVMVFKNLYIAKKHWKEYIKETWNIVDIVIILMSFTCVILYFYRNVQVGDFLDQLERTKHNQFLGYFHLIRMEEGFHILAATLICVATVRLWKLLRFAMIFRVMEKTLLFSARPLMAVMTWYAILLLAFTFSGHLIFGSDYEDFSDLTTTIITLTLLSINLYPEFDYELLEDTHRGLGYNYYLLFMFSMMVIFTLYVTILILSYTDSSVCYSNFKKFYTFQAYVRNETRYFGRKFRRRLKKLRLSAGGDGEVLPRKVTPKTEEHRYADLIAMPSHKISVMSLVARCVVLNNMKREKPVEANLSNYEANLMRETVYRVLKEEDIPEPKVIAFVPPKNDIGTKLVPDSRILEMEKVVSCILNQGTIENSQGINFNAEYDESEGAVQPGTIEQLQDFQKSLKIISGVFDNINIVLESTEPVVEKAEMDSKD